MERVTTRPAFLHKYSRRTNSCWVSCRTCPPRDASRLNRSKLEILNAEPGCLADGRAVALEQVAKARQQLCERKGLGEIVVAALFESAHAIVDRAARRQDQDRGTHAKLTQLEGSG